MSKIGNHRVGLQESDDYRFGWHSAERGEPKPNWDAANTRCQAQLLGWHDYHAQERTQ